MPSATLAGVLSNNAKSHCLFYLAVTTALLVLMRPEDINLMTGLAQAGYAGAQESGLPVLAVLLPALIAFALAGQLDAWIAGTTRLPARSDSTTISPRHSAGFTRAGELPVFH
jgi:hypothetical protein